MEQMQNMNLTMNSTDLNSSAISTEGQEMSHSERLSTIIGYMREEKQKETELRMNAELELQRVHAQTTIDQQRIANLDAELMKTRTAAEVEPTRLGLGSLT